MSTRLVIHHHFFVIIAFLLGTALGTRVAAASLYETIAARKGEFASVFATNDSGALTQFYTEDAHLLPPGDDIVVGRSAIKATWDRVFGAGFSRVIYTTLEVDGCKDLAYQIARYKLFQKNGALADVGKLMVIWKRVDEQWLIYRDIWNSDGAKVTDRKEAQSNE